MILECSLCNTRYMVPTAAFAQGSRQVRCTRCRHEWRAELPTNIDVFEVPTEMGSDKNLNTFPASPLINQVPHFASLANLPAVIKNSNRKQNLVIGLVLSIVFVFLLALPIIARQSIVKANPGLREYYEAAGFSIPHTGAGLVFEQVKSELRYDAGTMKLFVDGVIHNTTSDTQFIPDIKARALGPDKHIIQSWWVEAPAATVAADGEVPFHTEIASPMEHTIEDVYLEFYTKDQDKSDGNP